LPENAPTPANPELIPGELTPLGRITAVAALFGVLGTGILWIFEPGRIRSPSMEILGIVLAVVVGAVSLALPWHRLPRVAVMLPVASGAALTALACWNTGGAGSPFALFYLYLATMAAYFASRSQTLIAVGVVLAAAGLPVAYDHDVSLTDRLFEWVLVSAMSAALALVLQQQRERIRRAATDAQALALQDPLTGVPNRRGFEQRASAELARARRHGTPFSVLYVDLDGFKRINDVAGHSAGDAILRRVAMAISVAVRGEDFVARHGGDEFVILLPGATEAHARQVAARVVAAVERSGAADPELGVLSASVGGASFPADGEGLDRLLERADAELLVVKSERRHDRSDPTGLGFAVPETPIVPEGDPFAGLQAPLPVADVAAGWPLGRVGWPAAAVAALLAFLWLAGPAVGLPGNVRVAVLVGAILANGAACGLAAVRTRGRERLGWVLAGLAALGGWVPLVGTPAGVGFGLAILLIGALPARRDWRALLDLADSFIALGTLALVYVIPPLVAHAQANHSSVARAVTGAVLTTLALTCVLLVAYTTHFRSRPDLWLVAAGFGVAAAAAVPLLLTLRGHGSIPDAGWAVLFPVSSLAVASGALLRAGNRRPRLEGFHAARRHPGLIVGYLLSGALLASLVVTRGGVPAAVIPALCLVMVVRYARGRVVERDNARLVDVAHEHEREVADQYRASLVALGTALEARDGYTGGHGEETLVLVRRVAEILELSEAATAEAEAVALLHDIGKIGMPDEILRKRGPLEPREAAIMREHPVIGERILQHVPGLESVARAVRHEHERWDGAGYPDGLAGEIIPLASRITLVCDAYHAMTSDRPYRGSLGHGEAAAELRRGAGRQFDPVVVRALLTALDSVTEAEPPAERETPPTAYQAAS
jgi:diguanylate cyclase (GGDEF)-like protein